MVPGKYLAFFDIDNTILRINSGSVMIREAFRSGLMGRADVMRAIYYGWLYRLDLRETTRILRDMVKWIKGKTEQEFRSFAGQIVRDHLIEAVRPEVLLEIKHHIEMDAELVILSSVMEEICRPLADHLGIDTIISTRLEITGGKYTGRPLGKFCYDDEKRVRLEEYCTLNGYDKGKAFYYGDSFSDISALESVGNPVCVTPDKALLREAMARGWRICNW